MKKKVCHYLISVYVGEPLSPEVLDEIEPTAVVIVGDGYDEEDAEELGFEHLLKG